MAHVLLVGVSTRAAAESAAQAGFTVTGIDAFSDLDQQASVRALSLPQHFGVGFTAQTAARAAHGIECDAVAYLSSFENHPGAVGTLAAGRALWGNAPAVLRRVRDPLLLTQALRRRGLAAPAVYRDDPPPLCAETSLAQSFGAASPKLVSRNERRAKAGPNVSNDPNEWLVKPVASGGGHGVRPWRGTAHLPRGCYLQERIDGAPGSIVFVAAGGRAVPLGVSRQLVGEGAFGARGYRYCGNILAAAGDAQFAHDETLVDAACALARAVSEEFDLVGVNGIDFVARGRVPYAIEVNPRWCASMELVERAYGLSVFGMHAAACAGGTLPEFDLVRARRDAGVVGKAVVFARREVAAGDTRAWLVDASVRDVPHPGARIAAGRPVCTVFAAGSDAAACYAALVRRAERVYAELGTWERGVA